MAKKTRSLAQWCADNGRNDLLREVVPIKKELPYSTSPNSIEYDSPMSIAWLCAQGHEWQCTVVGRTLFNLKCPKCFPNGDVLPIGTNYGCLTIISEPIEKKEEIFGVEQTIRYYECQCKCGKIHELDEFHFLIKKHRYCTDQITSKRIDNLRSIWDFERNCHSFDDDSIDDYCSNSRDEPTTAKKVDSFSVEEEIEKKFCGLAVKAWKAKQQTYKEHGRRELADKYNIDFTGTFFESLEILECIDEHFEEPYAHSDLRKKDAYLYKIYKLYRCRCYLCGKEHIVRCSQFHISPRTEYGVHAYNGYWSDIQCDCHRISSFQWIVNKLLIDNKVRYRVEYSFPDLFRTSPINKLRYDFAVFNEDGSIRCLIECQGEQHYKPVEEFGGATQYYVQKQNDRLKREYAQKHGIRLIEISYKSKQIDKIQSILEKNGVF
ncbi:MAG: zinc-ribbon domain-containing protein [Oscillospiraceae bacterium]|nr:zinc-ribbon domain-containing protein [Oscillospiraceae bacterium]